MTRWNDYLAHGNAVHHYRTSRRRLTPILTTILVSIILATVFASLAAEYTRIAQ